MKKFFLIMLIAMAGGITASAQKFALVDMEYIMKKIPASLLQVLLPIGFPGKQVLMNHTRFFPYSYSLKD